MTASSVTMITMLQIIPTELIALERPTSPPSFSVNAGIAEPKGLNTSSTSVYRTSNG